MKFSIKYKARIFINSCKIICIFRETKDRAQTLSFNQYIYFFKFGQFPSNNLSQRTRYQLQTIRRY
ncbi:unnamed protein product [Paramecium pentaurelia]|uniref:Uncharacterized protein n=1 Tax=Paramecium pentaurelia TaxID=43138 RepID=A0A8S1XNI1_9CILI|nr:unnamed protein product [Paramecium pentaurelia]